MVFSAINFKLKAASNESFYQLRSQRRQASFACRREIVIVYGSIRSNVISIGKSGDSEGVRLGRSA